ncbi:GerAB/ArcD/ProY family transporter [Hathewaya limosa]|uniref:Spore germination protein KB n=1 Tax=Hathewaya limosa TaxID=1536 RepID=A0ABU0JR70_HATLI|nr:endospore germination permease [Hathewaya limosa]MDQ0479596.1 spore germination protein KB [Hathewaya limosa]
MKQDKISNIEMQYIIFSFSIGAYMLFSMGGELKEDAWVATLIALIVAIPIMSMYGAIINFYPGKNIFQIIESVFGKIFGKILNIAVTMYSFLLATFILRDFVDFIKITSLPNTPTIVIMFCIGMLNIYLLSTNMQVIVSWIKFSIRFIVLFFIMISLILIPEMHVQNLFPIFNTEIKNILIQSYKLLTFPFTELFIFLTFFDYVKFNKNTKNVFIKALLIGGVIAVSSVVINILLIGKQAYSSFYYAGYEAIKRIKIQGEFQRLEIIVTIAFTILQFSEMTFCVLGAWKGVENIFSTNNKRYILSIITISMILLSRRLSKSMIESIKFNMNIWPIYGGIIQIAFPIFIFIIIFIKNKILLKNKSDS